MQRAKRFIDKVIEAQPALPPTPPAIHQTVQKTSPVVTQDFIDYLKKVENGNNVGLKSGRWYPHKDPSGGFNIGYGHHLSQAEYLNFSKTGATDKQVNDLLVQDIHNAKQKVDDYIRKHYKVNLQLTPKQYQMLIDYVFNIGGLGSFPKMVDAVLRSDRGTMKKEYKRSAVINGKRQELTGRNQAYAQKFLECAMA